MDPIYNRGQSYLQALHPNIPSDAFQGIFESAIWSFTWSVILSRSLSAGLQSARLGAAACSFCVVSYTLLKSFQDWVGQKKNEEIRNRLDHEGQTISFILGWGTTMYAGHLFGLSILNKASFYATCLPMLGLMFHRRPTPIMGIIIR